MESGGLVRVYASADAIDAQLMQGRLESEGIPVLRKGEPEGPYRTGSAYLWVPQEREMEAREIVEAVRSGAFALTDDEVDETPSEDPAGDATPR
jgi:hypothetical protein